MKKSTGIQLTALALLGAVVVACSGTERLSPPSDDYNGISLNAAGSGGMPPTTGGAGAGGMAMAGGAGGMPMTGGMKFCDAPAEVFAATSVSGGCGNFGGCHGIGSDKTDFLSDPDRLLAALDAPSTFEGCSAKIIDTANPEASLLLTKLTGDFPDGCGTLRMPVGPDPLSDEDIECVRSWVTGQADAPDAPAPDMAVAEDGAPGGPPDPPVAAGCDRGLEILASSCDGAGGCHGPSPSGASFVELGQVQALVASGQGSASCGGAPLFDPANPAQSSVVQRMRQECTGLPMPPSGDAVAPDDIQCVIDWIGTL